MSLQLPEEKMPVTVYLPVVYLASGRASGHLKDFLHWLLLKTRYGDSVDNTTKSSSS